MTKPKAKAPSAVKTAPAKPAKPAVMAPKLASVEKQAVTPKPAIKRLSVAIPPLPDPDEPVGDLIAAKLKRFERLKKRYQAEQWLPVYFPETKPFAVVHFGDPHVDDDGCDWRALQNDIAICRETEGVYGGCVGDYRNNWVGRLVRLYMDQHTTHREGQRLAAWFLRDCGVSWAYNVLGNHDCWNEGHSIMGLIADTALYIPKWEAKLAFRAARFEWRVHVAHDFKGHSRFNRLHGPSIAAVENSDAELYVCGHRHTHGTAGFVPPRNDRYVRLCRLGAYKKFDDHALVNGFPELDEPASVMTIFNPLAKTRAGRILVFEDLESGADVLTFLRSKA